MNVLVRREVGLGREVLAAGFADVLGLSGVHVLQVGLEAGEMAELFPAEGAAERLARFRRSRPD
jgi:hypothetical protein